MNRPYWLKPQDLPEIHFLAGQHAQLEGIADFARERQHAIGKEIDKIRLGLRPTFPRSTDVNRIARAVDAARAGNTAAYKDHYFEKRGPSAWWISVKDYAPYKVNGGSYLWEFSEDEVKAFIDVFHTVGAVVEDHWAHGNGHSFVFTLKAKNAD